MEAILEAQRQGQVATYRKLETARGDLEAAKELAKDDDSFAAEIPELEATVAQLDTQLTDKLQFLLDAALGFINIEQNDVMKVFTVASVAAIPPVILAGVWGMNFQNMPELHLPYGYALALAAIALSIAIPLFWFKRRGWI